jgi:hypothetical protein
LSGAAWAVVALLAVPLAARAEVCPTSNLSTKAAVDLHTQLCSSAEHEDSVSWERLPTPDLTAIEWGKSYDRTSFFNLIHAVRKAGRKKHWSVTAPHATASCNLAVISYVNQGAVTEGDAAPKPVQWLETGTFQRTATGWRAILLRSVVAAAS